MKKIMYYILVVVGVVYEPVRETLWYGTYSYSIIKNYNTAALRLVYTKYH